MTDQGAKVGVNEALFREVNERIDQLHDDLGRGQSFEIVCECGDPVCIERFAITDSDYEELRRDTRRFAVVPGHERPELERTIEERPRYFVVEKTDPDAAQAADELA